MLCVSLSLTLIKQKSDFLYLLSMTTVLFLLQKTDILTSSDALFFHFDFSRGFFKLASENVDKKHFFSLNMNIKSNVHCKLAF